MEDGKLPFIDWTSVNVPHCGERSHVLLDLSLSLCNKAASSSTTTTTYDRKQNIHHKTLETVNLITVKSTAVSPSEPSRTDADIPIELPLFPCDNMSTHITTTDPKGKQPIICMEKRGSALSDSNADADYDLSLALSLSLGHHKGKQAETKCMEKSGSALSDSNADTDYDLSLALSLSFSHHKGKQACMEKSGSALSSEQCPLSLSFNPMFEGIKDHNLKRKDTCTSKKGKANKRSKVETVRLAINDPWCIKKKLFKSDLGDNARLLLPSTSVEAYVFPHWNADQLALIETKDGLPVMVWDSDTDTVHEMKFKRWNNGANVLIGNWVTEFVKRRGLKQDDQIGLYWDNHSSRFVFSVLRRAPTQ